MTQSSDMQNIRLQIAIGNQILETLAESLDEWSEAYRMFDVLAAYANGDKSLKFSALRILVTLLGRQLAFLALQMAAPESNQRWRISIKERSISERPGGGREFRKERLNDEAERIGVAYYSHRKEGLDHAQSVAKIQSILKLNLSESSIRQKLQFFRNSVKRRGYADRMAPISARIFRFAAEPTLLVSDIVKRGRPKKSPKSS